MPRWIEAARGSGGGAVPTPVRVQPAIPTERACGSVAVLSRSERSRKPMPESGRSAAELMSQRWSDRAQAVGVAARTRFAAPQTRRRSSGRPPAVAMPSIRRDSGAVSRSDSLPGCFRHVSGAASSTLVLDSLLCPFLGKSKSSKISFPIEDSRGLCRCSYLRITCLCADGVFVKNPPHPDDLSPERRPSCSVPCKALANMRMESCRPAWAVMVYPTVCGACAKAGAWISRKEPNGACAGEWDAGVPPRRTGGLLADPQRYRRLRRSSRR